MAFDRPAPWTLLAILAMSALAGCAEPAPEAAAPVLTAGDRWETQSTTMRSGTSVLTRTTTTVDGTETSDEGTPLVRAVSQTESSGRRGGDEPLWTTRSTATLWMRATDLAKVRTESDVDTNMRSISPAKVSASRAAYAPPCVEIPFPLRVGSTYETTCTVSSGAGSGNSESTLHYQWTVERVETVTVRAGTFEAFRLTGTADGDETTRWYAPAACGVVRTQTGPAHDRVVTELTAYRCASTAA